MKPNKWIFFHSPLFLSSFAIYRINHFFSHFVFFFWENEQQQDTHGRHTDRINSKQRWVQWTNETKKLAPTGFLYYFFLHHIHTDVQTFFFCSVHSVPVSVSVRISICKFHFRTSHICWRMFCNKCKKIGHITLFVGSRLLVVVQILQYVCNCIVACSAWPYWGLFRSRAIGR